MKEKRIALPGVDLVVRMSDGAATRVADSWPYRRGVAPALHWLERRGNGSNGHRRAAPSNGRSTPVVRARERRLAGESAEQRALLTAIEGLTWYHTIDLGHGVLTPGEFDHEPGLPHVPLPADLTGKRCLDVATLDGFWAFEMERRGAAEVVAIDIESWMDLDLPAYVLEEFRCKGYDQPTGSAFEVAARLRSSRVQRHLCNVYDLTPERVGLFDLVFCGDLLIHLTNPLRVLQNICAVTRGEAIIVEPYLPALDAAGFGAAAQLIGHMPDGRWWLFGQQYLEKALQLAGFAQAEFHGAIDVRLRSFPDHPAPRAIFRATGSRYAAAANGAVREPD
jgi:tRNA (mo5U34)-methyltransferase